MALEVNEVKAGPRRPAGGYQHNTKTLSPGVGELKDDRVKARPLKPGPKINATDGRQVAVKRPVPDDPGIATKERQIID
jgi:hypothetical protein